MSSTRMGLGHCRRVPRPAPPIGFGTGHAPACRRFCRFVSLAAVVLVAFVVLPSAALAWSSTYSQIADGNTGYSSCLDVTGGSSANGTPIQQWSCNGDAQQQWALASTSTTGYFEVVNENSGSCLDVTGGSSANGTRIQQWSCNGGPQQLWTLVDEGSSYELANDIAASPPLCLDVTGGSAANGTPIQQWSCNDGPQQNWSGSNLNQAWGVEDPPGYVATETHPGFDECTLPLDSQMSAWWSASPYYWIGVYIGGVESCNAGVTAAWLRYNTDGPNYFAVTPIWVGPQDPCYGGISDFSLNTATAYSQGETQADDALYRLTEDGFSPSTPHGTTVVYDLEGYAGNQPNLAQCKAAATSFISGWDYILSLPVAQVYGVYGSVSASDLTDLAGASTAPQFIWGALYDGISSTTDLSPVPSSDWSHSQRLKQYNGNPPLPPAPCPYSGCGPYDGVPMNVDVDSANGPAYYG